MAGVGQAEVRRGEQLAAAQEEVVGLTAQLAAERARGEQQGEALVAAQAEAAQLRGTIACICDAAAIPVVSSSRLHAAVH